MAQRVRVILNPTAGGGRASRRRHALEKALRRLGLRYDIVQTERAGHAATLATQARHDRVDVLAVVGGDGTLNEVVQAYLDPHGVPIAGPDVALIPSGTGGDFRKTLGFSGDLDEAVARIRFSQGRPLDLGILHLADNQPRAFVNITSFGIAGHVDAIVNSTPKWLGGRLSFFAGTLRAMAKYRNAPVRVVVDGKVFYEGPIVNCAIANGRYFGGGMMIAPHADPSDGRFEVVVLGNLGVPSVVALSPKVYRGGHLGAKGVLVGHGTVVSAEALDPARPALVDVDGEESGGLPLRAEIAPGALTFRG